MMGEVDKGEGEKVVFWLYKALGEEGRAAEFDEDGMIGCCSEE